MATTGYDDRMLVVEVVGLCQQDVTPMGTHTFKIPYRALSRTLQFVSRRGGKVVSITSPSVSLPALEILQISSTPKATQAPRPLLPSETELKEALPSNIGVVEDEPIQPPEEALHPNVEIEEGEPAQPSMASEATVSESMTPKAEEPISPTTVEPEASDSSNMPKLVRFLVERLRLNAQDPS